tara:strand:- start:249 stop:512 length:264 start_codon:yes stop_codon:yes gene_type:complete
MKPTVPVFEKLELTYVVREMRRIREWNLKKDCVLIKNRIYRFRLFMKRKVRSFSLSSSLIQMMKQNSSSKLESKTKGIPLREIRSVR